MHEKVKRVSYLSVFFLYGYSIHRVSKKEKYCVECFPNFAIPKLKAVARIWGHQAIKTYAHFHLHSLQGPQRRKVLIPYKHMSPRTWPHQPCKSHYSSSYQLHLIIPALIGASFTRSPLAEIPSFSFFQIVPSLRPSLIIFTQLTGPPLFSQGTLLMSVLQTFSVDLN